MSSNYKLVFNDREVDRAAKSAFKDTAFLLGIEFTKVITQPRSWAGFEGQRDIIDMGRLRSSQQMIFSNDLTCVYYWPVDYAPYVHEGASLRSGRIIEGRPWTDIARQQLNIRATFAALYQRNL